MSSVLSMTLLDIWTIFSTKATLSSILWSKLFYPEELKQNKANASDNSVVNFLDFDLSIKNGVIS